MNTQELDFSEELCPVVCQRMTSSVNNLSSLITIITLDDAT